MINALTVNFLRYVMIMSCQFANRLLELIGFIKFFFRSKCPISMNVGIIYSTMGQHIQLHFAVHSDIVYPNYVGWIDEKFTETYFTFFFMSFCEDCQMYNETTFLI